MKPVRALLLVIVLLALTPAAAFAASGPGGIYVPPGQSAASQYTEDVPTAGGNKPVSNVHKHAATTLGSGSSSNGSGGAGSGGSGGSGGTSSGGGSSIPASTLHALTKAGTSGQAAAALAQSLAPTNSKAAVTSSTSGSSPASQVLGTLAGSDGGSGIGPLLPIILIASLVLASAAGIFRLRRAA